MMSMPQPMMPHPMPSPMGHSYPGTMMPQAYPGQGVAYGPTPGASPYGTTPFGMYPNQSMGPTPMMGYGSSHGHHGTGTIRIQLGANNLRNRDITSKSDPFFTISRGMGMSAPLHRSEVIYDNLNPLWQPFTTSVRHLCHGDYHSRLRIDIYDYDTLGKNDHLGYCHISLRELMDAFQTGRRFQLNRASGRLFGGRNNGELYVRECVLWRESLPM